MTKKTTKNTPQTREELLAALAEVEASEQVTALRAEITQLKADVASLVTQRSALEKQNRSLTDLVSGIKKVLREDELRNRTHGGPESRTAALQDLAQRTSQLASAAGRLGVQQGTHDPATGLPFTSETKPARDLSVGAPEVTQRELSAIFPDLLGPEVEVVDD